MDLERILERGEAADISPEDLPDVGGSRFGGIALLVIGIVGLSNTVLDVSLDWLEDWWPAALIIIGGWILYRSRQEAAKRAE